MAVRAGARLDDANVRAAGRPAASVPPIARTIENQVQADKQVGGYGWNRRYQRRRGVPLHITLQACGFLLRYDCGSPHGQIGMFVPAAEKISEGPLRHRGVLRGQVTLPNTDNILRLVRLGTLSINASALTAAASSFSARRSVATNS
jgi:hypothetical protein